MKKSVYDIVTEKFISGLEKGNIPWKKTWSGYGGLPRNFESQRPYSGVNMLLLAFNHFESPFYLTFNQVRKLGGTIKKGSRSEMVVFWKVYKKSNTVENSDTGESELKNDPRFVLRYYNIFNQDQIEGIDFPEPQTFDHDPIQQAETIWDSYSDRPSLERGSPAYYPGKRDVITMPPQERFITAEAYYQALFHESIHSTAHKSRLNRNLTGRQDKAAYSFEELIAEIGSHFLASRAGINLDTENSQAYINGWITYLKNEKSRTIISAASKAQKACDYILGLHQESTQHSNKSIGEQK